MKLGKSAETRTPDVRENIRSEF